MNISLGYFLGHFCEFVFFVYFANTDFQPRKNYVISTALSFLGYAILFSVGLLGIIVLSVTSFFIINTILLIYCYRLKFKSAVFYSLILDTLSCVGEYVFLYLLESQQMFVLDMLSANTLFWLVVGGKSIYLAGILLLKRIMIRDGDACGNDASAILSAIPIVSMGSLTALLMVDVNDKIYVFLCAVFAVINVIAFYANTGLNNKNNEIKALQEEYEHDRTELSEYRIMSQKSESARIARHDLNKQLNVLRGLIGKDDKRAEEYIRQIRFSQREAVYTKYTDNTILNVLLAQKIKEAHGRNVEIHIHSTYPSLSFVSDMDTVAIFSNMIDNAICAAEKSEKREIYIEMYTVNKSYSAVKIEGYAECEPAVRRDMPRKQKNTEDMCGIKTKNISGALKKYGSELILNYDKDRKFLMESAIFHIPKQETVNV